jgi:hypothetical protein
MRPARSHRLAEGAGIDQADLSRIESAQIGSWEDCYFNRNLAASRSPPPDSQVRSPYRHSCLHNYPGIRQDRRDQAFTSESSTSGYDCTGTRQPDGDSCPVSGHVGVDAVCGGRGPAAGLRLGVDHVLYVASPIRLSSSARVRFRGIRGVLIGPAGDRHAAPRRPRSRTRAEAQPAEGHLCRNTEACPAQHLECRAQVH